MLKGKIAIVTGGTRGIGLAIVKKFLDNGATLILLGFKEESVTKALSDLKKTNNNYQADGAARS